MHSLELQVKEHELRLGRVLRASGAVRITCVLYYRGWRVADQLSQVVCNGLLVGYRLCLN